MALTPEDWAKAQEEAAQYTTDQQLDYIKYKQFLKTDAGRDWPTPTSIADFLANIDKWAGEMSEAFVKEEEEKAAEARVEEERVEEERVVYDEEIDRRREEAYEESRYAAEERYREPARYSEAFAGWVKGQGGISEALRGYVESEYPSLRAEYEATLPRETGFATREEARAEAAKREKGWAGWLQSELPDVRQDYYMQRPYARGERYAEQSPTLKAVNW